MSTIAEVLASQQQSYVGTYTAGNFDSMKEDIARWAEKNPDSSFARPAKRKQKCAQFDSKGGCRNLAEVSSGYPLDLCAKHNHMEMTGIPVRCWRCGDDR